MLPAVDIRTLDQDEALTWSRIGAAEPFELVIPSIDKAIFNESASSHRQTFYDYQLTSAASRAGSIASSDNAGTESTMSKVLDQMEGSWVSPSRKEKLVVARGLPKGWRVHAGLRKSKGRTFFHFRDFRSPDGQTFATFKDAVRYLMNNLNQAPLARKMELLGLPAEQIFPEEQKQCSKQASGNSVTDKTQEEDDDSGEATLAAAAFTCETCGKTFAKQSQYYGHQRAHTKKGLKRKLDGIESPVVDKAAAAAAAAAAASTSKEVLFGWCDSGCSSCKGSIQRKEDLVFCGWCEAEFHISCAASGSNELLTSDWVCSICR